VLDDGTILLPFGFFNDQYREVFGCYPDRYPSTGCFGLVQDMIGKSGVVDPDLECFYFDDFEKTKAAAELALANKKCKCDRPAAMIAYRIFTDGEGMPSCKHCGRIPHPTFPGAGKQPRSGPYMDSCVRMQGDIWLGATTKDGNVLVWPNIDVFHRHYNTYDTTVICVTCTGTEYKKSGILGPYFNGCSVEQFDDLRDITLQFRSTW
jgi:hypothetical protein